ncbi:MAG TPA: hypothetical protein VFH54_12620 [Mycobacteriales bacterium]|nr:hypothetical protein [Mycobacteriales bacterium]
MPSQSRLSTLYYRRKIVATDNTDLSGDTVRYAFMPHTNPRTVPTTGDFHAASYAGANVWQILIGPGTGGLVLTASAYPATFDVWEWVSDANEAPAEPVDVLELT